MPFLPLRRVNGREDKIVFIQEWDFSLVACRIGQITSPRELLAAKFHIAPALLTRLNPKASFETAGTKIVVPNVARKPSHDKVAEVVVDKSALTVRALDGNGKLISFYPASVGSEDRPSRILLENYYLPGQLEQNIEEFVEYYNNCRYHESLDNLTPADVYFGRGQALLERREKIKRKTIEQRRRLHQQAIAA
jgi:transposase InsO family protein